MDVFNIISGCPLFKGITPEEIQTLITSVQHKTAVYANGEVVAMAGDNCNKLMIVLYGSVKGEMLDFSGRVIKIEDITAPFPLATAFLFGPQNQFPVNIIATEETRLLILSKESVMQLFHMSDRFLENFLNAISGRAQFLSNKIKFLTFKTIKGKIALYLLNISKAQNSDQITLDKTQQELADYFGVARPSFARALGDLEKEGLISLNRKAIHIIDKPTLTRLLQ